ncbi:hypothetical protein Tco_1384419 [Tanacetum coccineum]
MRIQNGFRFLGTRTFQADLINGIRCDMKDDIGIPQKRYERHRERAITAEEAPNDTKPLSNYVPKLFKWTNESRMGLPLIPIRLTPLNGKLSEIHDLQLKL